MPTITTEAVTLASGGDRRVSAIYALLQALLPFAAFLLAIVVPAVVLRQSPGLAAAMSHLTDDGETGLVLDRVRIVLKGRELRRPVDHRRAGRDRDGDGAQRSGQVGAARLCFGHSGA